MGSIEDVLVVGAGPAGSSAAYRLAAAGARVLVLEKSEMPRFKLCGGAVSRQALDFLDFPVPENLPDSECRGVRIHYTGRTAEFRCDERVAILVSRSRFDHFLLEQALARGASVEFTTVRNLEVSPDCVTAWTSRDSARAAARSSRAERPVSANHVRPRDREDQFGYCFEQIDERRDPDPFTRLGGLADVHFGVAGFGYGWIFPHGDHYSVGVGSLRSKFPDSRGVMRRFWTEACGLPEEGLRPKGWPIPRGGIRRRLAAERMILAGDAAGFVDAFTGEGIAHAIRSGQQAAEIAGEALAAGRFSRSFLERAARRHFRVTETDLRYSLHLARLMHSFPRIFIRLLTTEPEILRRYMLVP